MADLRVLVVGASIAGPATAYWLSKAGAKVTVIERWPKFREGGHNVDLRSCGITVMSKMAGMEAAVRAKKCKFEAMTMVHADGRPIITFTSSGKVEAQSLMSEYEIFRGDLSRVIMDLTKDDPNVEYVFGEQVTAIQQDGNGGPATVTFMNGYPSAEFDLVVACDGATSRTRAIGLECGLRDYVHPLNTWWAYFSVPGDLLNAKNVGLGYTEAPGKSTFVLYDATGNRTRGGFMSVHPRNDPNALAHFHAAKKLDTEGLKKYVAERFASPAWKVPELIDALMQSDDLYVGELVQIKAPTLHRGRFVLVGDAGYSTGPTGGGTSMALAGAYILAGEILQHKGDLPAGLRAYEDRMRPIIKDLQTVPPGVLAAMGPQTEWGLWVRNLILGIVNWGMKFGSLFSWMGGWYSSAFAGDKFGLPEYEWVR
jgi:2-polyprenyl-6-methoxyphenol hydroxylase-like FAD-dependent oxidoreductase